jgi:hypothetical protein
LKAGEQRDHLQMLSLKARKTAEEKADWQRNYRVLLDTYSLLWKN